MNACVGSPPFPAASSSPFNKEPASSAQLRGPIAYRPWALAVLTRRRPFVGTGHHAFIRRTEELSNRIALFGLVGFLLIPPCQRRPLFELTRKQFYSGRLIVIGRKLPRDRITVVKSPPNSNVIHCSRTRTLTLTTPTHRPPPARLEPTTPRPGDTSRSGGTSARGATPTGIFFCAIETEWSFFWCT